MGNRVGEGGWTGGVKEANAEAGALVWVIRRNGCWWPGRILGTDELPEDCIIPPRSTVPVKLLGSPDGSIDWYNLEKSKHLKPFRCREFDECIENAKVKGRLRNKAYSNGKYAEVPLIDDAIMHALEIEMSHVRNEEPTNQTTESSKEDVSLIQDHRKNKMKIISFVTPISKENHNRDNSLLSQLDEGAMKCQALESDVAGLDVRVEGDVFKPAELENNREVYDVEVAAYGNYKGQGSSLTFLTSESTGKPIKGYPVAVEILEDSCPAPNTTEVHHQAISHLDCLMESRFSVPRQARSLRKLSGSRKIVEHDVDKSWSWGPSTRSFSSYCNSPKKSLRERSNRKLVVAENFQLLTQSTSKPASSPRQMRSSLFFPDSRGESANREPLVVKGSSQPSHSPPVAALDDSESNADEFHSFSSAHEHQSGSSSDEYGSDSSADEDYMRPTNLFAGSRGSPSFPSPRATSSRSISGCTSMYLCSASTLCAPVRLV